jgi:hypothetical protein
MFWWYFIRCVLSMIFSLVRGTMYQCTRLSRLLVIQTSYPKDIQLTKKRKLLEKQPACGCSGVHVPFWLLFSLGGDLRYVDSTSFEPLFPDNNTSPKCLEKFSQKKSSFSPISEQNTVHFNHLQEPSTLLNRILSKIFIYEYMRTMEDENSRQKQWNSWAGSFPKDAKPALYSMWVMYSLILSFYCIFLLLCSLMSLISMVTSYNREIIHASISNSRGTLPQHPKDLRHLPSALRPFGTYM